MDLTITALSEPAPTGDIRMAVSAGQVGLYMARVQPAGTAGSTTAPASYPFEAALTSVPVFGGAALPPSTITLPQPLPVPPGWDMLFTASGTGSLAYTVFGGGWNTLKVPDLQDGALAGGYDYIVESTGRPAFVQNTAASTGSQQFVSAIFSGCRLGVIGLQDQNGQPTPHVSDLVGSSTAPVATGRVFGDLSTGLPETLKLVYLQNKTTGPLAPSGAFCGGLSFASYDVQKNTLSTPVPLLPGIEISDFDLAVIGTDYLGLLAVTGAGAPLLALFDQTGKALGSANLPAGSWSNAGHWVSSPSIVATPAGGNSSGPGFSFAFVEMVDQVATTLHTGTLSSPPPTS